MSASGRLRPIAITTAALLTILLVVPLAGVMLSGRRVVDYLEFPPVTRYVTHAPFSWIPFALISGFVLAWVCPFALHGIRSTVRAGPTVEARSMPWWGWFGVGLGALSWGLAWTRPPWFAPLQAHTFTPLWLSYILVVNALTARRGRPCPLTHEPRFFLALFPVSAAFWWSFEYLNRFVQNWTYVTPRFGPLEYFLFASLSFSTVLPAVLSTQAWLSSFPRLRKPFARYCRVPAVPPTGGACLALSLAGLGHAGVGIWPDLLFALLWLSPLVILCALESLTGQPHVFGPCLRGDWRGIVTAALAALVCGFFWEMWNWGSLARWVYEVPFVHAFEIFEMPLLGYAGYLPFGVECFAVGELVRRAVAPRHRRPTGAPAA